VSVTDELPPGVSRRVEFKVGDGSKYTYFHYRPERNTFAWRFLPPPGGSEPAEETERFQLWRGEHCYGAKSTLQECVAFVDAGWKWRNWG
jgi:hypothetical protein